MKASKPDNTWSTIKSSFSHDFVAAISVALVALPLGLGIAIASGAPPIAGLIPAAVGGLLTTFIRGSHVAINGPSNGLIVVTLSGIIALDDGSGNGYSYVLAAFVIAGAFQILAGLFRIGQFGNYLPSGVISGMLAAIGVIIVSRQIYVAVGASTSAGNTFQAIIEFPEVALGGNGISVIIAVISLAILILHPRSRNKIISFVPAPMWVILVAFPLVFLFDVANTHTEHLFGWDISVGPELLIQLPDKVWEGLPFPDFSKIGTGQFWLVVLSVTLVASIESLLSAKAVDKLDPAKNKTNLNKDLSAMGVSTIASALLGGLPIITVILRSSVNVNMGAKTRMSNFYHGALILIMVLGFGAFIQQIPLAALAAILVFTGFKLTSPKVYRDNGRKGWEQLAIAIATILAIMLAGLLLGILIGVIITILLHWAKTNIPFVTFWRYLRSPQIRFAEEGPDKHLIRMKGVVNFLNLHSLVKGLNNLGPGKHVVMDFSHARLVDYTTLEYMHEFAEEYHRAGGEYDLTGLAIHRTSSAHPFALHFLESERPPRLSRRQGKLKQMAGDHHWIFEPNLHWDTGSLRSFDFFARRPIEYKRNRIFGKYESSGVNWEVADITFDEGALLATEVHHTTIQELHFPFPLPEFVLEKEGFLDKVLQLTGQEDIDFESFQKFSSRYLLTGPDQGAVRGFFSHELISFFEESDIYHLECKGKEVLVFRYLRLASAGEVEDMIRFSGGLSDRLIKQQGAA